MSIIDLRSDTVSRPTAGMRDAMHAAEVGDDVYGDDPTVNALEARVAALTGKEAALFVTSGTQSNLVALLSHCGRGDEFIVGNAYHSYVAEAGGAAALGGIQPCPLPIGADAAPSVEQVRDSIKREDVHLARTRLLCLENTCGGAVVPLQRLEELTALARVHGLRTHLDGARLWNAAVADSLPVDRWTASFDSVSLCLSKGLGAPAGSVLCGSGTFIKEARHWRKMLGGGLRQAGVLASAGLYALDHHFERLAEDHRRAALLHAHLAQLAGSARVRHATNMVFVDLPGPARETFVDQMRQRGIRLGARIVFHLDVSDADLDRLCAAASESWPAVESALG